MTKRKFNYVKAVWLILLCLGISFFCASNSQAIPIPIDVKAIIAKGPSAGTPYLTQYWLKTAKLGKLDAFCVEGARAIVGPGYEYELVNVPGGLYKAAGMASRYFDGGVLALGRTLGLIDSKTEAKIATQLAIWVHLKIIAKNQINIDAFSKMVEKILALKNLSKLDSILLAQSPRGGGPGPSQDYIVSVPDAAIMFLLGPALLGLGLLGRRKSKK